MTKELTPAERVFIARMAPHVLAGKTLEEAAAAVIQDDERLWLAATLNTEAGKAIRAELCREVYDKLRARPG